MLKELTQEQLGQLDASQQGDRIASTTQPAKAPSNNGSTWSDPRILKGDERSKFVTSVMNTTFHPERTDKETIDISKKVRTKV